MTSRGYFMNSNHTSNTDRDPTVAQTAEYFQVSKKTIYQRLRDGSLQSYKLGNVTRIKRESIERVRNGNE